MVVGSALHGVVQGAGLRVAVDTGVVAVAYSALLFVVLQGAVPPAGGQGTGLPVAMAQGTGLPIAVEVNTLLPVEVDIVHPVAVDIVHLVAVNSELPAVVDFVLLVAVLQVLW